ncbi:hypothetical protein G7046_g7771 [Stylonectria norvegica]|nr:hypothetical protein G7046_g7771 [Stylonectria norvegica]
MDDQFGGRTDDDLFYDDFEPVVSDTVVTSVAVPIISKPALVTETVQKSSPTPDPSPAVPSYEPTPTPEPVLAPAPAQTTSRVLPPAKTLADSRYASKPSPSPKPPRQTPPQTSNAPPNAPTAPKDVGGRPSQNTAGNSAARLQSGANPRQKLTDTELTAKMAKMKLVSAEKARQFEKAERDEKEHAEAYARGMQEARKRRVEEAEKRKRDEEGRRRMDDERARNRDRKLKALGMKEALV